MPHVRDVRATSHDQHDSMLVAALAAGDLAGADRDQAIDLTGTCADCSRLHDDLVAIARATAATPPAFAMPARDFRLTPADAARLRPGGWRRLVAALVGIRSGFGRPLGVGLATLGVLGLLVGNIQLGFGGAASSPEAARTSPAGGAAQDSSKQSSEAPVDVSIGVAGAGPAASAAASSIAAAPAPAASAAPAAEASSLPDSLGSLHSASAGAPSANIELSATNAPSDHTRLLESTTDGVAGRDGSTGTTLDLLTLASIVAIVAGLSILVLSTVRRRRQI